MGTILNGRVDVFRTIVAGLAKHKDLQLVLSIGDQLDPEQIGPVPKNAVIVKRAMMCTLLNGLESVFSLTCDATTRNHA